MQAETANALNAARRVRLIPHARMPLDEAMTIFREWAPTGKRRFADATLRGDFYKEPVIEVTNGRRTAWVRTLDWKALCKLARSLEPVEPDEEAHGD